MSFLPHYSEVCILKSRHVSRGNYARSVWLGLSQPLMNLPRMILMDVFRGLHVIALGLIAGLWRIVWRGFISSIISCICLLVLGLFGRLTMTGDEETKGEEIVEISSMKGKKA